MRFGFAVKVLGGGGLPSHDTRRRGSGPNLSVSLDRLEAVLAYLGDHDIGMYRMATALAPYASHPDHPELRHQPRECAARLVAGRDVDVMLEAKAKDLALLRLREQLTARGLDPERDGVRAPSAAAPTRAAGRAPSASRSP